MIFVNSLKVSTKIYPERNKNRRGVGVGHGYIWYLMENRFWVIMRIMLCYKNKYNIIKLRKKLANNIKGGQMAAIANSINILGGKPHIKGTRMSVDTIVDYLSNGYTVKDIQKDYPHLSKEQIQAALDYIQDKVVEGRGDLEEKS